MTTTPNPLEPADRRLLASVTAHASDQSMVIALEDGKQVASFKVGDFSCVLKESQIRCTK